MNWRGIVAFYVRLNDFYSSDSLLHIAATYQLELYLEVEKERRFGFGFISYRLIVFFVLLMLRICLWHAIILLLFAYILFCLCFLFVLFVTTFSNIRGLSSGVDRANDGKTKKKFYLFINVFYRLKYITNLLFRVDSWMGYFVSGPFWRICFAIEWVVCSQPIAENAWKYQKCFVRKLPHV